MTSPRSDRAPVIDLDNRADGGPDLPPTRLAWSTLVTAFEIAALVRCGTGRTAPASGATPSLPPPSWLPPSPVRAGSSPAGSPPRPVVVAEFNQRLAAQRMVQLLAGLQIQATSATATQGLRRRYDLHRVCVPHTAMREVSALLNTAWRQGREVILTPARTGATAARHRCRPLLAAGAWRAALLAAGRHVRRHVLGVHVGDPDAAAVLVRSAHLLDAVGTLRGRSGCFLVSVPVGPDRERILRVADLPGGLGLAA